jgi:hypothetical protein
MPCSAGLKVGERHGRCVTDDTAAQSCLNSVASRHYAVLSGRRILP